MATLTISRRSFLTAMAASGAGLILAGTGYRAFAQSTADQVVEDLAKTAFTSMPIRKINSWMRSFRKLNYSQMEYFNKLVADDLSATLEAQGGQGNAVAEAFRLARSEANKIAVKLYGTPFNQLSVSQVDKVIGELRGSASAAAIRSQATIQAGNCVCYNYTFTATKGGSATSGNGSAYVSASQQANGCADCDWDVTFPVNRQVIRYCNPLALQHYANTVGFIGWRTPSTTRIAFGWWKTLIYQGTPSNLLTGFRLD